MHNVHAVSTAPDSWRLPTKTLRFAGKKVAFFSDFVGTWDDGDTEARAALDKGILELVSEYAQRGIDLVFGYITARPPADIARKHLPPPDYAITYNGGMIHNGMPPSRQTLNARWNNIHRQSYFDADFVRKAATRLAQEKYPGLTLKTFGEAVGNPEDDESPFNATICVESDSIRLQPGEAPDMLDAASYRTPRQVQSFFEDLVKTLRDKGMDFHATQPYPFKHFGFCNAKSQ